MTTETKLYRPKVSPEDRDELMALAGRLGFLIEQGGTYFGEPSIRGFLAAVAEVHRRDPGGAVLTFKVLLGENGLLPLRPPTPPA
jgi:hypothetical protein